MPRTMGARWGVNSTDVPRACSISGVWRWSQQPIGGEVLVDGAEVEVVLGRPTGPGYPTGCVHHQRRKRWRWRRRRPQERPTPASTRASEPEWPRRIAARCGDELGCPQLLAVQLRQPVDEENSPAARERCGARRTRSGREASLSRKSAARSTTIPTLDTRSGIRC